jgi:ArsR family transcriptional regulator
MTPPVPASTPGPDRLAHGPRCGPHGAPRARRRPRASDGALDRAAQLFRAAGDPARLRLLDVLDDAREQCVSELAVATGAKLSTLSQQLRVLHEARVVRRRRDGKHVFYALADAHVRELVRAALDHAGEPVAVGPPAAPAERRRPRPVAASIAKKGRRS